MNKIGYDEKSKRFEGYKEGSILTEKVPQYKHQKVPLRPAVVKNPHVNKSPFNISHSKIGGKR